MTDEPGSTTVIASAAGSPRGLLTWICSTVSLNLAGRGH